MFPFLKHTVVALWVAGGLALAQQPGSSAPEFSIEKAWNGGPTSFADLAGKVVILDFAQTW